MTPYWSGDGITLYLGDCRVVLPGLGDGSVDAVVTDPPYGLEFMGKEWDAPWQRGAGIGEHNAGFHPVELADGRTRLPRADFTGSTNPTCRNCGGTRQGNDRQSRRRCRCQQPEFPNVTLPRMRAYQAWCETWAVECLRVLKPGGHLLAFGGTRTYHRLACALEDAGFEIRDSLHWLYGSGFPKSLDVGKAIDKAAGAVREVTGPSPSSSPGRAPGVMGMSGANRRPEMEARMLAEGIDRAPVTAPATEDAARWDGWGTALKPSHEPVVLARKPLVGSVAGNVLAYGTGALNVNGCRVGATRDVPASHSRSATTIGPVGISGKRPESELDPNMGRWPPNVLLSPEAAAELDAQSGHLTGCGGPKSTDSGTTSMFGIGQPGQTFEREGGGASRFFPVFRYQAKAPASERPRSPDGTAHPTVKPLALMRWLVRLITPPGGLVLDPFAGTGTTLQAAALEGFRSVGVEADERSAEQTARRLAQGILL